MHRGVELFFHGGSTSGFGAGLAHALSAGLSAFTLCNLDRVNGLDLTMEVMDILLADQLAPAVAPNSGSSQRSEASRPDRPHLTEAELLEYEGRYYAPELDREFPIVVEDGALILDTGRIRRRHMPTSKDSFDDGRGWSYLRFQRDAGGGVTGFLMDIGRVSGLIFQRVGGR